MEEYGNRLDIPSPRVLLQIVLSSPEHVIRTRVEPIKAHGAILAEGVVEPLNSHWPSPKSAIVMKKNGNYRFCVDFRAVNKMIEGDAYSLPFITHTLDKLSSLDINSAYRQVPFSSRPRRITAFTVPNRVLYQFRRMPMGHHNSSVTWQRLIHRVLGADLSLKCSSFMTSLLSRKIFAKP